LTTLLRLLGATVALTVMLGWALPAALMWPDVPGPLTTWRRFRCFCRRRHDPVTYRGAFRCLACGFVGADLEEMGYEGGGHVAPMRRSFSRGRSGGVETVRREEGKA